MKNLQMKYNLLHITFFFAYCAIYGYVAVFLQSKGMSNSAIGVVTGVGAVSTIFLSPVISGLIGKIRGLTVKSLLTIMFIIMSVSFVVIAILPLPAVIVMLLYIVLISLVVSCVPFLSTICMDYLKAGEYVNFGVSRGLGSIAYAVAAVVLGQMIEMVGPTIPAYVFVVTAILFEIILLSLPDVKVSETVTEKKEEKEAGLIEVMLKYKVYTFILLGFSLAFAAASALAVYLINIVTNLGGSTSLYGIAVFCMAASEMPIMAITHTLLKKTKADNLLLAAAAFYILRNFIITLAPNIPILLIGMLCQSFSYGLFTAVITYYVADFLDERSQIMGQTMIAIMTTGFGSTIGNVFGGILQDGFGLSAMMLFCQVLTVVGVAIVFITIFIGKKKKA